MGMLEMLAFHIVYSRSICYRTVIYGLECSIFETQLFPHSIEMSPTNRNVCFWREYMIRIKSVIDKC